MNKDTFIKLIKDPTTFSSQDAELLEGVVKNFPYCQVATILMAKVTNDKGSMFSNQKIKKAALLSSNRGSLRKLIILEQENKPAVNSGPEVMTSNIAKKITNLENNSSSLNKPDDYKGDTSAVRDEIYKTLDALKKTEANFFKDQTEPTFIRNPTRALEKEIHSSESKETSETTDSDKKKLHSKSQEGENLKYYIHSPEFGKEIKIAKVDLIEEYILFRKTNFIVKPTLEFQSALIEKFLEESPQMPRFTDFNENQPKIDLSKQATKQDVELVTENLANILIKQGKIKKAVEVLEKLKLKFPEKSTYFAEKIESLNSY